MAFRLLICGGTGTGKTSLSMNLLFNYLYYNKIYIFAKDMNEGSYLNLQDFFEEDNKTMKKITGEGYQVDKFSSSKDNIANVNDLKKKEYQNHNI